MTVTYDETLDTDRDYLRSLLNDIDLDAGPFPENKNFQDEQLDKYLSTGGSVNGAYIICCQTLAGAWAKYARLVRGTSLEVDARNAAEEWRKQAAEARKNPVDGAAGSTWRVFNATTD